MTLRRYSRSVFLPNSDHNEDEILYCPSDVDNDCFYDDSTPSISYAFINANSVIFTKWSLCAYSVAPPLRAMRLAGYCRITCAEGTSRKRRLLCRVYHLFALFATSTYVFLLFLHAYQMRSDIDKLPKLLYVMLCFGTCLSKQVVFHLKADEIDDLVARLDDPLMNQEAGIGADLMRGTATESKRLLRVYAGGSVATCVLWNTFPMLDRIQGRHVEFLFWIGFSYEHDIVFSIVMLYSFYVTNMGAVGQTAMDTFIATILEQCKTQLRILRLNFETLPERAAAISKEASEDYTTVLQRLLIDSLLHYKKIIELFTQLNDIFTVPLLVQFGVGVWILCMAAFEIVDLKLLSIEFATTSLFIGCILTELLLFCYYGTRVTVESDRVGESIYSMAWFWAPINFQRSLLVLMERAKRPLRPTAGLIMPLSLETYVTILKSSYSFYAVLRQTKEARS